MFDARFLKMIVGVCGLSWTGSGAVIDFLMEFDENQIYNSEFTLPYYPDGLCDLDYHLNYDCSKFLSSTVAIPRFRKVTNYLLGQQTNGRIKALTDDYLSKITQVTWNGDGQGSSQIMNSFIYRKIGLRVLYYVIDKLPREKLNKIKLYPFHKMEFSVLPDSFIEITQDYTDSILSMLGLNIHNKKIIINQAFPGNNPQQSMRYFRDSRAIVVDRDPRDLYCFFKKFQPRGSYSVPVNNIDSYIDYYRYIRRPIHDDSPNVLFIKFEDLVYEYEKTSKIIIDFLNLGEHQRKKELFIPTQSMINTRLYLKYPDLANDIEKITYELNDFLFDFDKYPYNPSTDKMFDDNPLTI